jgi:hypothetical protein
MPELKKKLLFPLFHFHLFRQDSSLAQRYNWIQILQKKTDKKPFLLEIYTH